MNCGISPLSRHLVHLTGPELPPCDPSPLLGNAHPAGLEPMLTAWRVPPVSRPLRPPNPLSLALECGSHMAAIPAISACSQQEPRWPRAQQTLLAPSGDFAAMIGLVNLCAASIYPICPRPYSEVTSASPTAAKRRKGNPGNRRRRGIVCVGWGLCPNRVSGDSPVCGEVVDGSNRAGDCCGAVNRSP